MIGKLFVNRKKLLASVEAVMANESRGRRHVLLDGRPLVGKTCFLHEMASRRSKGTMLVINLDALVSTPALFARNGLFLFLRPFLDNVSLVPRNLSSLVQAVQILPEEARQAVRELVELLHEEHPDTEELIRRVLDLPERLAKAHDRSLVIAYDGFESLLQLKTYDGLRKIDRLIQEVWERHKRVHYIVTGRQRKRLRDLFTGTKSFWGRKFAVHTINPLNRYDCYFIASLIYGAECRPIPRHVLPTVARYANGIPFYVEALVSASLAQAKSSKEEVSQHHINRALIAEVLLPGGRIHQTCKRILVESLSSVSGENSLRGILQILAAGEGKTLADISREMGRPRGQVHGYLKSLMEADLLFRQDKRFYFQDPMLRFFVNQALDTHWHSIDPTKDEVNALARNFFESFLLNRPETDLGMELRVRALSTEFEGQSLSGEVFGSEGRVILPADPTEDQLIDFDNDGIVMDEPAIVASDFLLKGKRRWMVEVKSEADPTGLKELMMILRKRRFFESRYRMCFDRVWVVSNEGFTNEARDFALDHHMLISGASDLDRLEELCVPAQPS